MPLSFHTTVSVFVCAHECAFVSVKSHLLLAWTRDVPVWGNYHTAEEQSRGEKGLWKTLEERKIRRCVRYIIRTVEENIWQHFREGDGVKRASITNNRWKERHLLSAGEAWTGSEREDPHPTGWVRGGGGEREPGKILVSHCLLFPNQLLSSAEAWKGVNEESRALECQGAVRGTEIKNWGRRHERDMWEGMRWRLKGIECRKREREEKKSSVTEAVGSVLHLLYTFLSAHNWS